MNDLIINDLKSLNCKILKQMCYIINQNAEKFINLASVLYRLFFKRYT